MTTAFVNKLKIMFIAIAIILDTTLPLSVIIVV